MQPIKECENPCPVRLPALAQHFDQINDYLATFFDGQATSADIERYLYTPLSAFTANAGKRHRPLI